MNAEALINTMLGTCTLQKLIGQGGMGAVFLAQQSRPRRQVAVKVLLPGQSQAPSQHAAFLERFRRETDAAASLEHPNIVPVHEYGERDGLAYLVMPYIGGGTLRDEMESGEQFLLSKAMSYLDQMAAALDFAHEHGVIHRDIKPANILMTPDRRLLLTDFGLVKVVNGTQGESPNTRLTAVGVPMGTPDYMAPEQVIGAEVDSRADIYSLGVILFQMVTGTTPFDGDMPMQIAMQHLHTPPPSPRLYRPDLPVAVEQVMLRSLAKNPPERFARAGDLASAFRLALTMAGVPLGDTQQSIPMPGAANDIRPFTRRSLFDPVWQGGTTPSAAPPVPGGGLLRRHVQAASAPTPQAVEPGRRNDIIAKTSMTMPSLSGFMDAPTRAMPQIMKTPSGMTPLPESALPQDAAMPVEQEWSEASSMGNGLLNGTGLRLGRNGLLRPPDGLAASATQSPAEESAYVVPSTMQTAMGGQAGAPENAGAYPQSLVEAPQPFHPKTLSGLSGISTDGVLPNVFPAAPALDGGSEAFRQPVANEADGQQRSFEASPSPTAQAPGTAAALVPATYEGQGMTGMVKLSQAMKVVQVPVAGKPGTFMTGLLPVLPEAQETISPQQPPENANFLQTHMKKVVLLVLLLVVVLVGTGLFRLATPHNASTSPQANSIGTPVANLPVQATANASATAQAANIILADSLSTNIHSWKESSSGNLTYIFKNGAYHVAVNNGDIAALADLPEEIMPDSFVFSVNTSEIKGDDSSVNNQFGLVFRLNQVQQNGQSRVTFYCFQVQNTQNDVEYQLRKYDSSYTDDAEKWTTPWHATAGKEYHFGHGTSATNTLTVKVKNSAFTFVVNGKSVGTFKDTSFKGGRIGLLVNQKGTEVAFSNLLLTHN
ncbi:MAG TPA: protein kinase [Ktedonobacteraceae bacterium]|jgi:serine/threonine protein kinase|nr:protein kinase [Ktedonobacteraceae bacterium]